MNRQLLPMVVLVIVCSGCDTETSDPKTTLRDTEHVSNSSSSAMPDENTSPTTDNSRDSADTNTEPIEGQHPYISFPVAGVKLVRPNGFDDAENFHGFQQPSTQSSVMVSMILGPVSQVTRGFTAEQLKARGMILRSKVNVEIDGHSGMLLSIAQNAYGTEFAKWILVFGNEKETKMITATFRKLDEAKLSSQLKTVVLSTKIDDASPPTPGADVGFSITGSKKLKLTRGIGKSLVYTKDGIIPAKSPEDPLFIAAPSLSKLPIQNKQRFAVERLHQTAHTKIVSVTSNNEITIDGLDGYELVADAEDVDSGTPLAVYHVVLFDDGSYFLIQGLVGAQLRGEYLPEFKAMARSLTRNPR